MLLPACGAFQIVQVKFDTTTPCTGAIPTIDLAASLLDAEIFSFDRERLGTAFDLTTFF